MAYETHKLDTQQTVYFYEQDFYVLSNFSAFPLTWKDIRFDTSEVAYHWEKFHSYPEIQKKLLEASSTHVAFKIAQEHKAYQDFYWNDIKFGIMKQILSAKLNQHPYVAQKLMDTGDRELVEDSWRDNVWGWGPNKDGQNALGKLWMEIRKELRDLLEEGQRLHATS